MAQILIFNKADNKLLQTVSTQLQAYRYRYNLLAQDNIDTYIKKDIKKHNKPTKMVYKATSKSEAKKEAWAWFSKYIRLKYADDNGIVQCVTCGCYDYWDGGNIQAGHYVDGRNNAVLLNEDIVYPQCKKCNVILHGNKNKYTEFMLKKSYTLLDLQRFESLKTHIVKRKRSDWIYYKYLYRAYACEIAKVKMLTINN